MRDNKHADALAEVVRDADKHGMAMIHADTLARLMADAAAAPELLAALETLRKYANLSHADGAEGESGRIGLLLAIMDSNRLIAKARGGVE